MIDGYSKLVDEEPAVLLTKSLRVPASDILGTSTYWLLVGDEGVCYIRIK